MKTAILWTSALALLLFAHAALAQQVVNPSQAVWTYDPVEHATLDNYELDVRRFDGTFALIQTFVFDVANVVGPDGNNDFRHPINVMPVSFGVYDSVIRACAAGECSTNSDPSLDWRRAPGRPSQLRMQ